MEQSWVNSELHYQYLIRLQLTLQLTDYSIAFLQLAFYPWCTYNTLMLGKFDQFAHAALLTDQPTAHQLIDRATVSGL